MKKIRLKLRSSLSCLMLLLLMILPVLSFAQGGKITIKGTVKDTFGATLPGVTVVIKGTSLGTQTATDGSFTISAPANATLVFSYLGFDTKEVSVANQTDISVKLTNNNKALDDVVVVGYGTQKKENLTGSIAVVNVKDADKRTTFDVARELQGQVAGVEVNGSGVPGEGVTIHIHGVSSLTNNNPLYVIDGVPTMTPFDFPTGDIETIQIIKDASASAIYGFRAGAGVVLITTKKARTVR